MWLGSLVGMSRVMFWVDAGFGQGVCFRRQWWLWVAWFVLMLWLYDCLLLVVKV